MSYDIIKKIRIETTEDQSIGMRYDKVDVLYACNNVYPRTYEWSEFCTNKAKLEEKVFNIFECALEGNFQLQSTCGKFYKIYQEIEELRKNVRAFTKVNTLDFDWEYRTNLHGEKTTWLAQYATDLYFKREPKNFELFLEDFARKIEQTKEEKLREFKEADQVSIRAASWADIFGKDQDGAIYDVLADHEGNIWLCKREDYKPGILSNASKAIKFEKSNLPQYGILYGVLAGNYSDKWKGEVLEWYENRPLQKASVDLQFDAVQKLLNSMQLPAFVKKPWKDFQTGEAVA